MLDDEEIQRVITEYMETMYPEFIEEDELAERVAPLLDQLMKLKLDHTLYTMYTEGLLKMSISPEDGEVLFSASDLGRQALNNSEPLVQIPDDLAEQFRQEDEEEHIPGPMALSAHYWIEKWLNDPTIQPKDASSLTFYLAEHNYRIAHMREEL